MLKLLARSLSYMPARAVGGVVPHRNAVERLDQDGASHRGSYSLPTPKIKKVYYTGHRISIGRSSGPAGEMLEESRAYVNLITWGSLSVIIHVRDKRAFHFILDKVQSRIAGWKSITSIHCSQFSSVTAAIPNYYIGWGERSKCKH